MNLYTADFATALATAAKTDNIHDAVGIIMDILGVTTGDQASVFFTGDNDEEYWAENTHEQRLKVLTDYAISECIGVLRHAEGQAEDELEAGQ
jgi:hypothetical protein